MSTNKDKKSQRDAYGEALLELMDEKQEVLALTADLASSTRLNEIRRTYPERFLNIGVAEQNAVGVAAGLSLEGFLPFLSSFAVFVPGRCLDQIRVSVCQNKANVKLVGSHLGFSNAGDGATAQSVADLATMNSLPEMAVLSPLDAPGTAQAVEEAAAIDGPVYLRMSRAKTPIVDKAEFSSRPQILQQGEKATLVGTGPILARTLPQLEDLDITIINVSVIKPLKGKVIKESSAKTKRVITLEEHSVIGGLGEAVSRILADQPAAIHRFGFPDVFGESARTPEKLYQKHGLDPASLKERITNLLP